MLRRSLGGGWEASLENGSLIRVATLMGIAGLLSCALPTLRALRVQPTTIADISVKQAAA